jgi:hydrogenase maturation factor
MNLVYAEIVEVEVEDGMRFGNVTVSGAIKKVPLDLVQDVTKGDKVLLCDGVAIAKTNDARMTKLWEPCAWRFQVS